MKGLEGAAIKCNVLGRHNILYSTDFQFSKVFQSKHSFQKRIDLLFHSAFWYWQAHKGSYFVQALNLLQLINTLPTRSLKYIESRVLRATVSNKFTFNITISEHGAMRWEPRYRVYICTSFLVLIRKFTYRLVPVGFNAWPFLHRCFSSLAVVK